MSVDSQTTNSSPIENLITEHINIWTSAIKRKSSSGRGSSKKIELYGIKKLRELILELAVRGKLVAQDASDEPASVLLERIAKEKAQLVKEGKIKKQKSLPDISEDEKPFELPDGWEWSRIGTIFNSIMSGGTPSKRESDYWGGDIPWASVKDLGLDRYISITQDHITKAGLDNGSKLALKGELLICTRMGLGKIAIVNKAMAYNQDLKAVSLSSEIDVEFFLNYYATLNIKGTGTTVAGIGQDQLLNFILALPPLAEQHRIVAKVDELMALCDQLEAQTDSSLDAHQTLVAVLLDTLVNSQNAEELTENWTRISGHFDTLFTTEHSIDQLKQTILQLAVMGKLVEQNPYDEPASALLERIAAEKEELVKQKKIKKQKPLPPIAEEEKPFELPEGWEWIRFASMSNEVATGPFGSMIHKRDYVTDGVPLINPSHMINSEIREDLTITVNIDKAKELRSYKLFENDIVMARRGEMGRCALVTKREENWLCGTGSFVLRFNDALSRRFILLLFRTSYVCGYLGGKSIGTTMTNLNHSILNKMPLLLPPVTEQHRIVEKVDELMAICDQLKARLSDAQTRQLNLADALVEQAL